MAIIVNRTDDHGNNVSYWNIGCIDHDFKGQGVTVTLYGYRDEAARREGRQPPLADKFQLAGADYPGDVTRGDVYSRIKSMPEYFGATDA